MKLRIAYSSQILALTLICSSPSYAVISSPKEADESRKTASVLYKQKKYDEAELHWRQVLSSEYKTPDDVREIAIVYGQEKKYEEEANAYSELIRSGHAIGSDFDGFMYSLRHLIHRKSEVRRYKDSMLTAYDAIIESENSDQYEIHIASLVFSYFQSQENKDNSVHIQEPAPSSPTDVK